MKLPDGVVGLRKVRTVFGGEDSRTHLTWVLAYNAGIEVGSPRYEAIRAFAGNLKAPPRMEQSVMFLPVAAPDISHAPPPPDRASRKPRRARPKKRRPQAAVKPTSKRVAKTAKTAIKRSAKSRRPPRSRPRRARR